MATVSLRPPCPHCGGRRRYGHGSTATCADCQRFVDPELPDRDEPPPQTQTDAILRRFDAHGEPWVIRR